MVIGLETVLFNIPASTVNGENEKSYLFELKKRLVANSV